MPQLSDLDRVMMKIMCMMIEYIQENNLGLHVSADLTHGVHPRMNDRHQVVLWVSIDATTGGIYITGPGPQTTLRSFSVNDMKDPLFFDKVKDAFEIIAPVEKYQIPVFTA